MRYLPFLCLTAVLVAFGQQTEEKKPAVLEGRIVNSKTGEPVRRVNLTLRPFGTPGMGGAFSFGPAGPAAPYSATTDADGKFRIEKVEPGSYRMMAERQGYVRREYGAKRNAMMGTTITVSPGQELKDLNFDLTPQAVITGRVLDDEGEPLARVQIQVMRHRYLRGKQQLMPMGGGQTIDTGEFRVADLAPGRYWLSAIYRGRMMMFGDGPARNTVDKPEEEYVTTYYPDTTDQASARPIDLVAGQEMPGIDIRLQKARVFRIRGKVGGGNQPVRNLRVMIVPRESRMMGGFMGGGGGMVKEDGSFEIGGVQPGSYYVIAVHAQGMPTTMGKVPVDVTRDNVENVSLNLVGGSTVTGAIRIDGNVEQLEKAQGKKITFGGVRIQLAPMDGVGFNSPGVQAKDDGSFMFENVGPEKYRIMAMNLPQGTWLKSVRGGDQEVLDSGLDLNAGVPGPVQITLGVGPGAISGTVQDEKQKAVSGSMIALIPDPVKEERYDLFRIATTDQNGQFTMQGVPPGEYKILAAEEIDPGNYMDPEFLKKNDSKANKISVKENSQQSVSLTQIVAEAR
jgi:hypothetical protein